MKKLSKKAAALLLAAAMMAATLAGCGGSSDSGASEPADTGASEPADTGDAAADTGDAAPAGDFTDYSGGFPENVTIQIPVYDRAFEGWNVTDNYYTRWIQEEFGDPLNVTVEYVAIPRGDEVNTFMQLIAAHTAPDIIFHYDMPAAVNYWDQGAMQPIDYDEVAFYAPDYWANMQDTIKTYGNVDGEQAFIFASRYSLGTYYQWITLVRQDWLDEVGMDMPTNWDEAMAVGEAWKEAGLGTWGYALPISSFTYFYGFIGPDVSDEEKALYLDLNVAPLTWSATENYLRAYNEAYNKGVVDTEFYLNLTDADQKAKFVSGQVGTYGFYIANNTDVFSSLLANDPDAKVSVLGTTSMIPEGNPAYFYEYPAYGMIMGINADSTPEERAATYMFLNWMSQPDNLFKLEHGVEGETFEYDENGLPIHIDNNAESKLSGNNNKDYWCLVEEAVTYGDDEDNFIANKSNWAPEGYADLIDTNYHQVVDNLDNGLITPIFTKVVASTAEYSGDLNSLWQEACTACVRCKPEDFDATYAEYCEEYLDAGYQEILDEKQSLIDEGAYLVID